MLNDLTPAEQRTHIEGLLHSVERAHRHKGPVAIDRDDFKSILRLALAAVPKIEWADASSKCSEKRWEANLSFAHLVVSDFGGKFHWAINVEHRRIIGTAPTLEAAQAAAEAALLKLIGGGE